MALSSRLCRRNLGRCSAALMLLQELVLAPLSARHLCPCSHRPAAADHLLARWLPAPAMDETGQEQTQ